MIAIVLIIYYKQITEGLEDAKRFKIMEKVRKGKAAKIKPAVAPRPRPVKKAEKTEKQESATPRDEDDPYNE